MVGGQLCTTSGSVGLGRACQSNSRLGRRQGPLGRTCGAIRLVVALLARLVVNIVAVSVACAGRRSLSVDALRVWTRLVKALAVSV